MKNAILLSAVFFMLSCNKYPDGPALSIRSKTARVSNTWKVENYMVNGQDRTALYAGYLESFSPDGNYTYTLGESSGTGRWNFQNNSSEIKITGISNLESRVIVILRLENNSFWYYYTDGKEYRELHLVPAI
jgi:hypothetical protein